jgi:steroid 5-alpha reductase family enzyme
MDFLLAYKLAAVSVAIMMTLLWLSSLLTKDASIVDRFWGAGFVLIAWVLQVMHPAEEYSVTRHLVLWFVTIWGLRLSLYIHFRNQGHGEDYRYLEMRNHHGSRFWWYSFLSVFLLQGVLMLMVAAPVILVLSSPDVGNLTLFGVVGMIVWCFGFILEAGGDWQLAQFKKNPANKGQLLTSGLWSITRHPNYFGDALQWWGLGVFAVPYGSFASLTLLGPLVMTLFIRKVSGVDLLEKNLSSTKPGYENYIQSTPPFLPRMRFWGVLIFASFLAVVLFQVLSVQ